MIILDIETTGLSPDKNSIASIGAVDFANPNIQFMEECQMWNGAEVDDAALVVTGDTLESLTAPHKKTEAEVITNFLNWLEGRDDMVIAGQNVFFDTSFLRGAAKRAGVLCNISVRIVDLHSITYAHMIRRGITPPIFNRKTALGSDKIMEYVGIGAEPKPHIAINGALYEAEAFSRLMYDKTLLAQFEGSPIPWV